MKKVPITIEIPDAYDVPTPGECETVISGEKATVVIPLRQTRRIPSDGDPVWVDGGEAVRISAGEIGNAGELKCYRGGEKSGNVTWFKKWYPVKPEVMCEEVLIVDGPHRNFTGNRRSLLVKSGTAKRLLELADDGPVRIGIVKLEDNQ